jgi:metallo-beta-lactamase family protein
LSFFGAAGTVTGSRCLLRTGERNILIDCGLFQGVKQLRLRNWEPFPVPPSSIDAVIVTHAHIDHSGYLPVLKREGFNGPIYCTPVTRDLCGILLPDSARLQEEDARFANRHGYSRHHPARPLYTVEDAAAVMPALQPLEFGRTTRILDSVELTFGRAGHIMGAAWVQLRTPEGSFLFTGDLGPPDDPIVLPAEPAPRCDYVITESTYGDRKHASVSVEQELAAAISETAARGGVVLVPAFAVGRAQLLLHYIARLAGRGAVPNVPVYLDSPLAEAATRLLSKHPQEHRLSADDLAALHEHTRFAQSVDESKDIDARNGPMVIVAGSGMASGGRILHHLKRFAGDHRNLILLTGFQAPGTRGAALLNGATELKIHGAYHSIAAQVRQLRSVSGHMDAEQLVAWCERAGPPRQCFITHGEPAAADALRHRLEEKLRWQCTVPDHLQQFNFS